MVRRIFAFLLFFAASAQGENLFFWKVNAPAGPVYLLGSIHFATKDFYPLNPKIEDAFKKSETLIVEVNLNELDAEAAGETLLELAKSAPGETLHKHLSKEDYEAVQKEFDRYGLDASFQQRYKPWFLALILGQMELQRLGYDPELGIDKHFLDEAKTAKKNVNQLETFETQVHLLDSLSMDEQAAYLIYTVRDMDETESDLQKIVNAWKTGNVAEMEKILFRVEKDHPALAQIEEKVLDERNRKMTLGIEDFIKANGADFVVVGAAHLIGSKGIIELLKAKGYEVEQF